MSDALLHTISNVLVLVLTAGIGWLAAQTGKLDDTGRITTAKIVNLSIPFFLFNSVTTKFTHDQLVELLGMAWLPFVTVCLNLLISLARIGLGVACVTEEFSQSGLGRGVILPLRTDFSIPPRAVTMCTLQGVTPTSAAKRFMDFISESNKMAYVPGLS